MQIKSKVLLLGQKYITKTLQATGGFKQRTFITESHYQI